jgi:hypothetical protein
LERVGGAGNRNMLKKYGGVLRVVEDEIAVEKVGRAEEKFHWVLAVKQDGREYDLHTKAE